MAPVSVTQVEKVEPKPKPKLETRAVIEVQGKELDAVIWGLEYIESMFDYTKRYPSASGFDNSFYEAAVDVLQALRDAGAAPKEKSYRKPGGWPVIGHS